MIFADVSSGRSDLASASLLKRGRPDSAGAVNGFDRRRAAFAGRREGRGAHGDDLLRVGRLHRLHGVAGVDRTLERVGRNDFGDFRHLRHVEQGGDARQHVLAGRGRRRDDGVVGRRQRHDQVGERFGDAMGKRVIGGRQHLFDAGEFRCGLRGFIASARDQDMHRERRARRRRQRLGGGIVELAVVDFGEEKSRHQRPPLRL